jgi:hypothetical protein
MNQSSAHSSPPSLRISFEVPPGEPAPPAELVASICATAATLLADDRELQSFGFLGSAPNSIERIVPIDTSDIEAKNASVAELRRQAAEIGARHAILVAESWYLEVASPAAIRNAERGIADREDRKECVMVSVEVVGGRWVACAPIHREPGRTWVDTFAFRWASAADARFFGILPRV